MNTAGKLSKYRVFSGPNTRKYGPEKSFVFEYISRSITFANSQIFTIMTTSFKQILNNFGFENEETICKIKNTKMKQSKIYFN